MVHAWNVLRRLRIKAHAGGSWSEAFKPMDGGSEYLSDRYRRFGAVVSTGAGYRNPAFGFAHGGGWTAGTTIRLAAPHVCAEPMEVRHVVGSATQHVRNSRNTTIDTCVTLCLGALVQVQAFDHTAQLDVLNGAFKVTVTTTPFTDANPASMVPLYFGQEPAAASHGLAIGEGTSRGSLKVTMADGQSVQSQYFSVPTQKLGVPTTYELSCAVNANGRVCRLAVDGQAAIGEKAFAGVTGAIYEGRGGAFGISKGWRFRGMFNGLSVCYDGDLTSTTGLPTARSATFTLQNDGRTVTGMTLALGSPAATASAMVLRATDRSRAGYAETCTNLMDAGTYQTLGSYSKFQAARVEDPDSTACFGQSCYAVQWKVVGSGANSAGRFKFTSSLGDIPANSVVYVSVYAKVTTGQANVRLRAYANIAWSAYFDPLDGGSPYLTSEYRLFGGPVRTGSSSFVPAFNMLPVNVVGTTVRLHTPSVCSMPTDADVPNCKDKACHVAVSLSETGQAAMYLNGALLGLAQGKLSGLRGIVNGFAGHAGKMAGEVADLRVYSGELKQSQVAALYHAHNPDWCYEMTPRVFSPEKSPLVGACQRTASTSATPQSWSLSYVAPVASVYVRELSICRKIRPTQQALHQVEIDAPDRVCGLDHMAGKNPTCQPTELVRCVCDKPKICLFFALLRVAVYVFELFSPGNQWQRCLLHEQVVVQARGNRMEFMWKARCHVRRRHTGAGSSPLWSRARALLS